MINHKINIRKYVSEFFYLLFPILQGRINHGIVRLEQTHDLQ